MKREGDSVTYTKFEIAIALLFQQIYPGSTNTSIWQEPWWPRIEELKQAAVQEWQEEQRELQAQEAEA